MNPWSALRQFTAARVALGRHGPSLPTAPQLAFQLAHAMARDAVHTPLDVEPLRVAVTQALRLAPGNAAGDSTDSAPDDAAAARCLLLHSAAATREVYLQRPDLGRQLGESSRAELAALPRAVNGADVAFVVADGLSALAVQQHAAPLLAQLIPRLLADGFTLAPLTIVQQARVAIGDEIGELLGAKAVVVLIGERPGLSSPDSMGLYMTWAPRRGLTDEARNCISNVRPEGLCYETAAYRLHYLLDQARKRGLSGIQLKDETVAADAALPAQRTFLLL
ncbi:ethanolamine ammonia-lyase subunit EutC [Pseudoduganella sp. RAF53_2]|uniref:ethanolamine ammonia-lyase subunit EutC n=1 Tax=unclassified Pseudoduganella TaxID=2637179 RepID=UPI003F94BF12